MGPISYLVNKLGKIWTGGRSNYDVFIYEAKLACKVRLGDSDRWGWFRIWLNGLETGRRTAWKRTGEPIPLCPFCSAFR